MSPDSKDLLIPDWLGSPGFMVRMMESRADTHPKPKVPLRPRDLVLETAVGLPVGVAIEVIVYQNRTASGIAVPLGIALAIGLIDQLAGSR